MTRGRKPTPTHLKLVQGNPGKRRINHREPVPIRDQPSPPPELSDDAKVEWGRICDELWRLHLLTVLDRGALAIVCQCFGDWIEAERMKRKMAAAAPATGGLLVKGARGNKVKNPLIAIARQSRRDYLQACQEFGMTPSARTRLETPDPRGSESPKKTSRFFRD